MTIRAAISVFLAAMLACASPAAWLAQTAPTSTTANADQSACQLADSCPCCVETACPCAGEAPQRAPEAPIAPRPTSDLRIDIAPVPARTVTLIALPIAQSCTKPASRRIAMRDEVRVQAVLCIWRT